MLDDKDIGLTEGEKSYLQELEKKLEKLNERDGDTDGEMYAFMRLQEQISNLKDYARNRKCLKDRQISFTEIPGGFIIQSPTISYRKFYYYPGSLKWRQEGKSKYYRCKNTNDFLDRFVLDTSFKGKNEKKH